MWCRSHNDYSKTLVPGDLVFMREGVCLQMSMPHGSLLSEPWEVGEIMKVKYDWTMVEQGCAIFSVRWLSGVYGIYGHDLLKVSDILEDEIYLEAKQCLTT